MITKEVLDIHGKPVVLVFENETQWEDFKHLVYEENGVWRARPPVVETAGRMGDPETEHLQKMTFEECVDEEWEAAKELYGSVIEFRDERGKWTLVGREWHGEPDKYVYYHSFVGADDNKNYIYRSKVSYYGNFSNAIEVWDSGSESLYTTNLMEAIEFFKKD